MTSKIQQAKNEKQLKELARLAENKRCAICTCMGTQYTCQPPSIFICSTCAGAMYHFPGFRVKSRSMATYITPEVQQMKEGGNAVFARTYLAKWNANSFPAPTDKNPKKVEEFIKQVLVDKVFYSETPEENKPAEIIKPTAVSSRSLLQQQSARSLTKDSSWKAFSDEGKPTNSGRSSGTAAGENWAEFSPVPVVPVKSQAQPFDPFAPVSPVHASPKSIHSTPPDPFAAQRAPAWEAFQDSANGQVQPQAQPQQAQSGWSQFDTKPAEMAPTGISSSGEKPADAHAPLNGASKAKAPVMDPLPEEWFSMGTSPSPAPPAHPTGGFPHSEFQGYPQTTQQSAFAGVSAFSGTYQQPGFSPVAPQPQPQPGYNAQAARTSLGNFSSFRSTAGAPQQWPQQPTFASMQKQDSMTSYVSNRVDETSHNPLFQNLDMDMRSKAHSVTGVPIQTPSHSLFPNPAVGNTSFNRPNNTPPFQQPFLQTPPQRGFDDSTGNPFA